MLNSTKRAAIFLDRDGTVNIEKEYLHKCEDFEFIPGVPDSIRALKDAGYLVIVVTNQSGVGRGYYSMDDVTRLHKHLQAELLPYETAIDAFYACPHHPTEGLGDYRRECDCRKGAPGMLLQAAGEYNIDLAQSYIVGDKLADIEAGQNAGCEPILVLTGYGSEEVKRLADGSAKVCSDLADAANYILSKNV